MNRRYVLGGLVGLVVGRASDTTPGDAKRGRKPQRFTEDQLRDALAHVRMAGMWYAGPDDEPVHETFYGGDALADDILSRMRP